MSTEQKFPQYLYLRVPRVSTWKAEFLCHMGILYLLPSLPPFFIFLCSYSYRLPFHACFSQSSICHHPTPPASCVERMSAAHVCLYLGHKFAFPFPLRFIQQIFCQLQRWRCR
ncbi:hypothetical protein K457DRAFT_515580 [Linnemannia elongata AG-77]|uniref:Uncharacterized protein n=1 Tax=Linnemannia elongata AG-77 TaxID=1314771 RepID=A0A197JVH5_9FUNG|nr:hypothetical protein K457DRAFT_515580 [Linnemannia elongata AG-77]